MAATAIHNPRDQPCLGAGTIAGCLTVRNSHGFLLLWSLELYLFRCKETSCVERAWCLSPQWYTFFLFRDPPVTSHSFSFPLPLTFTSDHFPLSYMLSFLVCSFHLVKMHFIPSISSTSLNLEQKFRPKPKTQASPCSEDTCTLSSVAPCFLNPSATGMGLSISLEAKPLGESYETTCINTASF